MENNNIGKQIVELRISLQSICDGFSTIDANKKTMLSMNKKVLFVLNNYKNCPPLYLIENLGIAKSNLALLCKSMCADGTISVIKSESDKRNVFYNITNKGLKELNCYYNELKAEFGKVLVNTKDVRLVEKKLDEILEILNKKNKKN